MQVYGYLTITWYRNNRDPVPNKAYSRLIPLVNVTTSVLTIPNVTSEDDGAYYCVVWANRKAAESLAASLDLAGIYIASNYTILFMCNVWYIYLGPPSPLVIMTDPVVNLTVNNYKLTIKCLPNNSNFNYKWIKKNEALPPRAQGASTSQLTITNLKPEDSGYYQCVMSNNTGTVRSNFSAVKVKGKKTIILLYYAI